MIDHEIVGGDTCFIYGQTHEIPYKYGTDQFPAQMMNPDSERYVVLV